MSLPNFTKSEKLILISVIVTLTLFFAAGGGYVWIKSKEYVVQDCSERSTTYPIVDIPILESNHQATTSDQILPTPFPTSKSPSSHGFALDIVPDQITVSGRIQKIDEKNLTFIDNLGNSATLPVSNNLAIIEVSAENKWQRKNLDFFKSNLKKEVTINLFPNKDGILLVKDIIIQ